jgi:MFS family permease
VAARKQIVLMLGGVLALESADLSAIGAIGPQLEYALGISHAQLGLLAAAGTLTAAVATIPVGVLADRVARTPLLAASVALWSVAMLAAGAADSFATLLASRIALGALTATAGPTLISLVGDYFPAEARARNYGLILGGEMVGAGFGFEVSGNLGALLSWRWSFWVLVPPAVVLAVALRRWLPEPPRGGRGDDDEHVRMSLPAALRYVLSVRTNLMLLVAASVGNFFFAGVRTFTVLFIRGHYGLSQALATSAMGVLGLGALAGVLAGGRISDRLGSRGHRGARLTVAGVATLGAAALWPGPLLTHSLALGLGLGVIAAASMSVPNAPIDAARLDVIPARLRGRAESVRSMLRAFSISFAPLVFGWLADHLNGGGAGVRNAFLVMLVPLALNGVVLLAARGRYQRDMAAAQAADAKGDPVEGRGLAGRVSG